jgi:short-subunit dehydrogenase
MLCNVAGMGGTKDYLSLPLDSLRYMVRLNVESAMALSLTLLHYWRKMLHLIFECCEPGSLCAYSYKKYVFSYKVGCAIF